MIVTEDTKRIAQQALDWIIMHPEHHSQSAWIENVRIENNFLGLSDKMINVFNEDDSPMCGTTMCIAGTIYWQQNNCTDFYSIRWNSWNYARDALGLNGQESTDLFLNMNDEIALDALTAIANGDEDKFHYCVGFDKRNSI